MGQRGPHGRRLMPWLFGVFLILENIFFIAFVFYVYRVTSCQNPQKDIFVWKDYPQSSYRRGWTTSAQRGESQTGNHEKVKHEISKKTSSSKLNLRYVNSENVGVNSWESAVKGLRSNWKTNTIDIPFKEKGSVKTDDAASRGRPGDHIVTQVDPSISRERSALRSSPAHVTLENNFRKLPKRLRDEKPLTLRPFTVAVSSNSGFADFTVNWLMSLRGINVAYNVTIWAEDTEVSLRLGNLSELYHPELVRVLQSSGEVTGKPPISGAQGHHDPGYKKLINKRPSLLLKLLETGVDVLLADVDTFWIKDPMTVIAPELDQYDVWVAPGHFPSVPCPCFMYFKTGAMSVDFVKAWIEVLDQNNKYKDDQAALGAVIKSKLGRQTRIKWLDLEQFPDGDTYRTNKMKLTPLKDVYVFHANRVMGRNLKKSLMKRYGFWKLKETSS